MKQQLYVKTLEKSIDAYLNNITALQAKLEQEEKALQRSLRELRLYETNHEIATYSAYAANV